METKKKVILKIELVFMVLCLVGALVMTGMSIYRINNDPGAFTLSGEAQFVRANSAEDEGYDDDSTVCEVEYATADGEYSLVVTYTYEEWEALPEGHEITGYLYTTAEGETVPMSSEAEASEIKAVLRDNRANEENRPLQSAAALGLLAISIGVIYFFDRHFTAYEKIWFISIMALAAIFAIAMPEDTCNGINGVVIMLLYLADTFLNILCELLISKQSKWNFIVSVFVEIVEIVICIVLSYRFATMATTLFFWLPCDIISFINWHKHPDKVEAELTEVRRLKGWQAVLVITGIVVWTLGVGYALTLMDLGTDLFGGNELMEVIVCYVDACASAVGIANGLFILFRFREQWIAWYICSILEAAINIIAGQFILLVLKAGYLTNTTYGYIKWTKYIKSRETEREKLA